MLLALFHQLSSPNVLFWCEISCKVLYYKTISVSTGGPDVLLVKLIYKQQYVCEVYTSKINCKEVKIFIK